MIALYALLGFVCLAASSLQSDSTTRTQNSIDSKVTVSIQQSEETVVNPKVDKSGAQSSTSNTSVSKSGSSQATVNSGAVDSWFYVGVAVFSIVVAALVFVVKRRYRKSLGIAFAISLVLFLVPQLGVSSLGLVGLLACIGFLIHFLVPQWMAEKSVFIGIGLAFLAFAFAVAGGLAAHPDFQFWDRYSTAFYEATQLPLMNMSPHDGEVQPETKFYFTLARIFGCLFAYFVAYKTVAYVCERAGREFWLGLYCFHSRKKVALVIGLGTIGRRLIRNLLAEGHRVVSIESDKDSVHIERAQALGAQVIVGDALDDRVYDKIPFDAISSIYVVAGDDRKNLEISHHLLTYSIRQVEKSTALADPKKSPWWCRCYQYLRSKILRNEEAVCHVQVYDSNMQSWMEKEYFKQQVKLSHIEMRHFNAQQNAVRDLVQRELTKPGIRPKEDNEVGLYVIVGLEELGQEVALGLAQLAHFDNLKRSRILVLCSDPQAEAAAFLARYPKFTVPGSILPDWKDVQFDCQYDDWNESTTVVRTKVATGGPATKVDSRAIKAKPTTTGKVAAKGQQAKAAKPAAPKVPVTFATNAIFTQAPVSPSEASFLDLIYRLTKLDGTTVVKPSVIVCDKDVSRSFQWSSEFAEAWNMYSQRKGLQPDCPGGEPHPSLTTYFWLQGHKALTKLATDNLRHVPFGLEEHCISTALLDATLIRKLASVVEHSYGLATSSLKVGSKCEGNIEPTKFEFLKSNLQAAAHSLIKFQVAGGRLDQISVKGDTSLPKIESVTSFPMEGYEYSDPQAVIKDDPSLLMKLGKMEHNRWMAEQLLKGYEFIEEEKPRITITTTNQNGEITKKDVRAPQHEHQRATLCCWSSLSEAEQLKDLRQAYYVLYHLNALAVLNTAERDKAACTTMK